MDDTAPPGGIGEWRPTMPLPVASGEVVQVLVQYTIEEQECENVWYFRALAGDTDALIHLLADIAACLLPLIPILASTFRLDRLRAKVVSPAVGLQEDWTPAPTDTVQGAAVGDARSSHDAALISLYTTRPGKSGRGRAYIGGVPEGSTVGSRMPSDSALYVALLTFVACMLDKFKPRDTPVEGNYEWGVMSRKIGGGKPPFLAAGFAPIRKATVDPLLSTQRSRKIGHGR